MVLETRVQHQGSLGRLTGENPLCFSPASAGTRHPSAGGSIAPVSASRFSRPPPPPRPRQRLNFPSAFLFQEQLAMDLGPTLNHPG